MLERISQVSPRSKARITGLVYVSIAIDVLGFLAEALLMLWLLVMGVNGQRWVEQARTAGILSGSLRPQLRPA